MTERLVRKTRLLFPVMILFLIAYLLASPEKIIDKTALFRNSTPLALPSVKESNFTPHKNPKENVVPGQIIVKFSKEVSQKIGVNPQPKNTKVARINELNSQFQVTDMHSISSKNNNLRQIYRLILDPGKTNEALAEYKKADFVEYAEPNYKARLSDTSPNDPKYQDGTQWSLNQVADHDIDAPEGWDHGTGSSDTVIAVIDSGVDIDHPDLVNKIWHNAGEVGGGKESNDVDDDGNGFVDDYQGWDWVTSYNNAPADNDPDPEPDGINNDGWYGTDDGVEHGTHVAGIAGAETNNGVGIAGVCWDCSIMGLRVLDDEGWGDYTDIALAIEYATDNGADVINMSLGGGYSDFLGDAIEYAYTNDVVVVAAAGNSAVDLSEDPASPVCNDNGENMVIGVAATTSSDRLAGYSNYGWHYTDVSAPGSSIYSTVFHDPAFGFNSWYQGGWSGTSMASPHVAGLAGLVKSNHPTWSAREVRDRVINLTDNIDNLNSSYTYKMGSGRINIDKSLDGSYGVYPSGTFFKLSGTSRYYAVDNGLRRQVGTIDGSPKGFLTYYNMYGKTITASQQVLNYYPPGPALRYRDAMTLATRSSGKMYALSDSYRRYFSSSSLLATMHYDPNDLFWNNSEYQYYHLGPMITSYGNVHPDGAIIRYFNTMEGPGQPAYCYRIENGTKRKFPNTTFLRLYYNRKVAYASLEELASYPSGEDIRWYDGKLIGDPGTNTVYFIEYNRRRVFPSMDAFNDLGFDENDILWDAAELAHYTAGIDMPSTLP